MLGRAGEPSIIDVIHPVTGLTQCFAKTAEQIAIERPGARRMTIRAWTEARAAQQRTPIVWLPTTEAAYTEALEVLPPALWLGGDFLVGEPVDHAADTGEPRFQGFRCADGAYLMSHRPMTKAEMRQARRVTA